MSGVVTKVRAAIRDEQRGQLLALKALAVMLMRS
jgi:hypothetical protein